MKSFDEVWENIHATQEWGKYPSEQVIRFVARNYYRKERHSIKMLDFGVGGGETTLGIWPGRGLIHMGLTVLRAPLRKSKID